MEETRQEGDEQVWVEPAGRALPGGRSSHVDAAAATWMLSGQRRASCSGWQAAGVNTFPASPSVNACQAVAGSRVGNKVEPGP